MGSKVTVIVINWNGETFLKRCLDSLMAQTVQPDEIILVDNASSDRSIAIARMYPLVRIIALEQNVGFAGGNNLAIESSSKDSDWIALVNSDAFADSKWLEALLDAAKVNLEFDMFSSKLVNAADPTILDGAGDAYHVSGLIWRLDHGNSVDSSSADEREIFSPCAAAALYRRSVLLELGGFDRDYFCYVEDVDLGFRFRLAGRRCLYVPKSVARHVGSGSTGSKHSDFALYHGHRNLVWTFVKDMPSPLFWLLFPLHMALNIGSIFWFILHGKGRIILRAKRDAMSGLLLMWRKRQKIQNARVASVAEIWRLLDKRMIPNKCGKN